MAIRQRILLLALASAVVLASGLATAEEPGPPKTDESPESAAADRPEPDSAEENEIYSCQDGGGNLVLQTDPCPKGRKGRIVPDQPVAAGAGDPVVKQSSPVVNRARGPVVRRSSDPAVERSVEPVMQRPSDSIVRPSAGAVAKPSSVPAGRSKVARVPQRIETEVKNSGARTGPAAGRWILVPRGQSAAPTPRRTFGKQTFPTRLGDEPLPASASFSTPERTWRTFVAAIERGDRAVAVDCFTPAALDRYGPDTESFPLDDLRALLDSFTRIENGGDLGPLWSIQGVRTSRKPKWIFFEETPAGEWKLTGI